MFDVYVAGVEPSRIGDLDAIRENVRTILGAEGETLDMILSGNTVCIQENISEQNAIKIRDILTGIGLVCSYQMVRKQSRWGELSIHPLEAKESDLFTCPACNEKYPLEDDQEPKLCPGCGANIEKFRQQQKEKQDYEELRKNMQAKAQARQEAEEKERLKDDLKKRKADMEEKISKELGLNPKPGWKAFFDAKQIKKSHLIAISVLAASAVGLSVYKLAFDQDVVDTNLAAKIPETPAVPQPANPAQNASIKVAENVAAQTPEQAAAAQLPTQADITETMPTANAQELMVAEGGVPSQAALAKTHSDVTKFLNSVGIDSGQVAAAGSVGSSSGVNELQVPGLSPSAGTTVVSASQTAELSQNPAALAQTSTISTPVENRIFLDDIYHELDADVEWDVFLNKKLKEHIKSGKLKSAYTLSQFQTDLNDHVDGIAELVAAFSKLGRNDLIDATINKTNQKIRGLPQEEQPAYLARFSLALQKIANNQNFFEDAEKQALSIQDAIKQSQALSKVALYQKNAGQTQGANKNFSLAQEKLVTATPGFEQFSGFITLADDYTKSGNALNAEAAIKMAEFLLDKLEPAKKEDGMAMLLNTAYLANDNLLIRKYSDLIRTPANRFKASYQFIKSQLREGGTASFLGQLSDITDADYSAVATGLAALIEADPEKQKILNTMAQQKVLLIQDTEKKAVAASKVARNLSRQGKDADATALFDQALIFAQAVKNPKQQDAVFILLAMDKARVFQIDGANQIVNLIHDEHLKAEMAQMLKDSLAIKALATT